MFSNKELYFLVEKTLNNRSNIRHSDIVIDDWSASGVYQHHLLNNICSQLANKQERVSILGLGEFRETPMALALASMDGDASFVLHELDPRHRKRFMDGLSKTRCSHTIHKEFEEIPDGQQFDILYVGYYATPKVLKKALHLMKKDFIVLVDHLEERKYATAPLFQPLAYWMQDFYARYPAENLFFYDKNSPRNPSTWGTGCTLYCCQKI